MDPIDSQPSDQATRAASAEHVYLVGVSCVGKTTIGARLAERLGFRFFDLDEEVKVTFGLPIGRIQQKLVTRDRYQAEAAKVLTSIIARTTDQNFVMALPPSGLRGAYLRALQKDVRLVVALNDDPENIRNRAAFYDDDGNRIHVQLDAKQQRNILRHIKADIRYFATTYRRADLHVQLAGANVDKAVDLVHQAIEAAIYIVQDGDRSSR